MYVNISRNKLLINHSRYSSKPSFTASKSSVRCNHCGGLVRLSGEREACIMCSRDVAHSCGTCAHLPAGQLDQGKKKTA